METIFVVDYNDVNLTKAQRILERHYRILTIPSAARMFALIAKITPDLILLDIDMPEMDGFAALVKLTDLSADEDMDYLREQLKIIETACSEYDDRPAKAALESLKKMSWKKETKDILDKIAEHLLHSDFGEAAAVAGATAEAASGFYSESQI